MKIFTSLIASICLTFLFGLTFSHPTYAATYTVSGTVTDNTTASVSGATVDILEPNTTTVVDTTTTDSNGNYSVVIDEGHYDINVTPLSASLSAGIAFNKNIDSNTDIDFVLAPDGSSNVSGYIYDAQGNPLENQTVSLMKNSDGSQIDTTTSSTGAYSFEEVPNASYRFIVRKISNSFSIAAPQTYFIFGNYNLTKTTLLDVTIPAKQITIHVKDRDNNPVNNVAVHAGPVGGPGNPTTLSLPLNGGINASAENSYGGSYTAPVTNSSGDVTLWLLPTDTGYPNHLYTFSAVPPEGSGLSTTELSNIAVVNDANVTITMQEPVTISGHVYDPLGAPLANQTVSFLKYSDGSQIDVTTNSSGEYSFSNIITGTQYRFIVEGRNNNSTLKIPQSYSMFGNYTATDAATIDVTVPAKKVIVHVKDIFNNPVSNVAIGANPAYGEYGPVNFSLPIGGGIVGTGTTSYGAHGSEPVTDSEGNVTLWLLPNNDSNSFSNHLYVFTATTPSESIYSSEELNSVSVTGDKTETITLGYSHDQPVTTATLSPEANGDGEYNGTVTASLSAVPASGYTIANTYYEIDGSEQQIYTGPFTISDVGEHEIVYWSVDNSGVREENKMEAFTISALPIITLTSIADTYIKDDNPNDNEGSSTILRVRESGHNRGLVKFSQAQIASAVGSSDTFSAKLRVAITDIDTNWSVIGRTIDAHRMTKNWAEGNGYIAENFPSARGTGNGATWNCAIDTAIQNSVQNCNGSTAWDMLGSAKPYVSTASATTTVFNTQIGYVEFDVTKDVQAFLDGTSNYGWLVKKTNEGQAGSINFGSKETIYDPQLVIDRN